MPTRMAYRRVNPFPVSTSVSTYYPGGTQRITTVKLYSTLLENVDKGDPAMTI